MNSAPAPSRIKARKRGNRAGILFFVVLTRIGGLSAAYAMLNFVCLYYFLADREAARSALAYVRRRFPAAGPLKHRWLAYRLFVSQGRCLIDRNAMLGGRFRFHFRFDGRREFEQLVAGCPGLILLTSHVGNWQIAMGALDKLDKPIHLLMRREDNDAVRRAFRLDQTDGPIRIISIDEPFGGVVEVMNALRAGHVVSLMGDRPYDFDSVAVDFLGAPARFPYSAFTIAAMAEVPVAVMYSAKISRNAYAIEVPAVYYPRKCKKGDKQELWAPYVQQYADTLAAFLRKYPLQFFAFQDLWTSATPPQDPADDETP